MNGTPVNKETLKQIIKDLEVDPLIEYAQQIGKRAAEAELGTSQVRNIYGMVKQMQTQTAQTPPGNYSQLKLLIPKLHYVAAKQSALKEMAAVLTEAIKMVDNQSDFKQFAGFFEAIVAYHYAAYVERKGRR